jgi:outer membrane protein W
MKRLLLVFIFIGEALFSSAQDNSFRISYDVAVPMGQLSDKFINSTSWRGVSVDNRWAIKPNFTVGLFLGWQVFAQRVDNVTETSSDCLVTFHGTQFRTINSFPLQANAHYYLCEEDGIRPWVGLGIGTAYSDQRMQVGFYETRTNVWSFTTSPQVGVDIPLEGHTSLTLNARYNYFNHSAVSFNYSFLVVGAGIKFAYW